jgi:hypothetical protein
MHEAVFFNFKGAQESIPLANVAWRAGSTTLFLPKIQHGAEIVFFEVGGGGLYSLRLLKNVFSTN